MESPASSFSDDNGECAISMNRVENSRRCDRFMELMAEFSYLTLAERTLLIDVYMAGKLQRDIGEELGITEATTSLSVKTARKKIEKKVSDDMADYLFAEFSK